MSYPSTSSSISRMDIFEIPVELKLEIFGYLYLTDMSAIISASPTMLRCFKINEQRILKRYKNEIGDFYQSLSNIYLAYHVGRLHRIRERHRFDTQEVVETQVRPVLDEIKKLNFAKGWDEPGLTPVQLEIARNLKPFISEVLWLQGPDGKPREAYIESFLRYECYTKIFYHDGGFLFTGTSDMLANIRLFNKPSCGQMPPTMWQGIYRFDLRYLFSDPLQMKRVWPKADILGIERHSKVLRLYKMHLMMQGYSFLSRLNSLDPTDLDRELLDSLSDFKKNNKWAEYDYLYTVWLIWFELHHWV
ncbi:unnamed protein product [Fusarium equiseti]|uniref:F-box domain-containing protein n=1 Tax=Fusarium equiseti TaxID=61235 RepID=A0A8J2IFA6_FUSEQ|nr:unnamed protein product [Fusarium equiseti]